MKYLLKNKSTNEETLCTKVIVDGFDYYVSDNYINILNPDDKYYTIENPRRIVLCSKHIQSKDKVVIATNNQSIDIGQVIDRLGIMAHNSSPYISISKISNSHLAFQEGFEIGYNTHAETHTLSDDEVVEFLEWSMQFGYEEQSKQFRAEGVWLSSKELLNLFKEQLTKTIYYAEI